MKKVNSNNYEKAEILEKLNCLPIKQNVNCRRAAAKPPKKQTKLVYTALKYF